MSLQVWLPLNGDLHNQGLSNLTFTNVNSNYTTIDNSGKIGKCYINNSHTEGGLVSNTTINLGQKQSMFCWFKFTNLLSSSSLGGNLVSQHRYSSNQGLGISIKYVSSTTGYLSVNTGNGSSRTYNTYCGTTLLQANTWYHGGFTYDNGTMKIYVNGICENTVNIGTQSVPADYLVVFAWSLSSTSGSGVFGNYKLQGSLNDVRVYNHCLSEQEIKKLAQGLVVHYPLNRQGWGQENLVINSINLNNFINESATYISLTRTSSDLTAKIITTPPSGSRYGFYQDIDCTVSTQYTVSFEVVSMSGDFACAVGSRTGNSVGWSNLSGYTTCTIGKNIKTFTTISDCTKLRIYMGALSNNSILVVKNVKLEKGSIATPWCPNSSDEIATTLGLNNEVEYDISGFGNNGTRIGGFTWSSNTPKYEVSTQFNGANYIKTLPGQLTWFNYDNLTIAAWIKPTTTPSSWTGSIGVAHDGSYSYKLFGISNYGGKFTVHTVTGTAWTSTQSTYVCPLNEWHHYAATLEGTTCKMYIDGALNKTFTVDWGTAANHSSPQFQIGVDLPGTDEIYTGYYSDARIYATALSADEIFELYHNF